MDQISKVLPSWSQPCPQRNQQTVPRFWLGRETVSINPSKTKVSSAIPLSIYPHISSVWRPTPSEVESIGTAALRNSSFASIHNPKLEENPICEAIIKGQQCINISDTGKVPAPITLGETPIVEDPTPLTEGEMIKQSFSLTQTASSCREDKSRPDTATVAQATSAETLPDISSINHASIISTLRALKGQDITANFEYIYSSLNAGFASFSPKGSTLCIQVSFKIDLTLQGISPRILREKYVLSGKLAFDDDAMIERVESLPAESFMEELLQHTYPNPIHFATDSIRIFEKESVAQHLMNPFTLTKGQQKVYDTITSLYNKQLNTAIVSLRNTPKRNQPLLGQARFSLTSGQYLFISFKILPKEVDLDKSESDYLEAGRIRGRLKYDKEWLVSQISNNSTLLHSLKPETLPEENNIFFPPKSIILYFQD